MMDDAPPTPEPGRYRHFKGGSYYVLLTAVDSETGAPLVIYTALDTHKWYARPLDTFCETVEWQGRTVPRFELVSGEPSAYRSQAGPGRCFTCGAAVGQVHDDDCPSRGRGPRPGGPTVP